MREVYQKARRLRARGQCRLALETLAEVSSGPFYSESDSYPLLLTESAACHLNLHQFSNLKTNAKDLQTIPVSSFSKEACLLRLQYATARFHTDMALQEAWDDAKEVGALHVANANAREASPIDIELLGCYSIIESLARQFLDVQPPDFSPNQAFFEELYQSLQDQGRFEDLILALQSLAQTQHQQLQIQFLQAVLKDIGSRDKEMQVHAHMMLAFAFQWTGNVESALQELARVQQGSLFGVNLESQLSALYLGYSLEMHSTTHQNDKIIQVYERFLSIEDYYSSELLDFLIAEKAIINHSTSEYIHRVTKILERRSTCMKKAI